MTIGRSAQFAELVIDDASLSRLHARFVVDGEQIRVEDVGATNGTFVRGQRITSAVVTDGTEVRLGEVIVIVRDPRSAMWVAAGIEAYDGFFEHVEEELVRSKLLGHVAAMLYVVGDDAESSEALLARLKPALRPVDRVGLYGRSVLLALLPETSAGSAAHLRSVLQRCRMSVGVATASGGSAGELVDRARSAVSEDAPPEAVVGAVFVSSVMNALVTQLRKVAKSQLTVLLRGETGTGKDVLANLIHDASGRQGPVRAINCGAIPASLLESTLFGHERGAFTGADRAMPGLFEQAQGGTVFLDEVGELSGAAQAALLRVLETHRVQRLGSDRETLVDVRVLAATHVDLLVMSQGGRFREDLFYRLEGYAAFVPPLRERREEIEPLTELFLRAANRRHACAVTGVGALAREVLHAYSYPGNVRELRNAIERAVVVATSPTIEVEDLPERIRAATVAAPPVAGITDEPPASCAALDLRERVRAYERGLIERALAANGGSRAQTAEALGLPLRSLFYKLKELGINEKGS